MRERGIDERAFKVVPVQPVFETAADHALDSDTVLAFDHVGKRC